MQVENLTIEFLHAGAWLQMYSIGMWSVIWHLSGLNDIILEPIEDK